MMYYTIFQTKWGHFGLAGTDEAVTRTCLPVPHRAMVERALLLGLGPAARDVQLRRGLFRDLQEHIAAYFEGENIDFSSDPPLDLDYATDFGKEVLRACRAIPMGKTTTYSDLAGQIGRPGAARAVGGVMAANPIPLIIPCHRVLRTDGHLGGFSAPGGIATKKKMLAHERRAT